MDESARQLGLTLEWLTPGLADAIVTRHEVIDPTIADRYGTGWRESWTRDVRQRLACLSQAVSARRDSLFAFAILDSQAALAARGLSTDDLRRSLDCTRAVLDNELPDTVKPGILPLLDEALAKARDGHAAMAPNNEADADSENSAASGDHDDTEDDALLALPHAELVLGYLESLLDGRREDGIRLVLDAYRDGLPLPVIYEQVLAPALGRIGTMWHRGEITVSDEHYATAATQMLMSRMRDGFASRPSNGRCVVALSVGGDLHEIGARMVAEMFELDGWDARFLGANVPTHDALMKLEQVRPHLVALAASTSAVLRTVDDFVRAIRDHEQLARTPVLVGGKPFDLVPDLWHEVGANGYAASPSEAVALGNRLATAS